METSLDLKKFLNKECTDREWEWLRDFLNFERILNSINICEEWFKVYLLADQCFKLNCK